METVETIMEKIHEATKNATLQETVDFMEKILSSLEKEIDGLKMS